MKNAKSIVQFFILFGIGVLLIWLSLRKITPQQRDQILNAFATADYFWVSVSLLVSFFSHFLRAYRWNYLLEPLGHRTKLLNANCHVFVGYLANYGIPRMGEVTRCTLAAKYDKVPFEMGFGTVITERVIDFAIFLVIFCLTLAVQFTELIGLANEWVFDPLVQKLRGDSLKLYVFVGIIVAGFSAFFFLRKKIMGKLRGKFGNIIKGLGEGLTSVRKTRNPLKFIFLSFLIWACYFYSLYTCMFAIPETSKLGQDDCLTLLLFGTLGVIFAPGGLGAFPYIISTILMTTYKIDAVPAIALPWLSWTSQFILILILGLASLIVLPFYNRTKNELS